MEPPKMLPERMTDWTKALDQYKWSCVYILHLPGVSTPLRASDFQGHLNSPRRVCAPWESMSSMPVKAKSGSWSVILFNIWSGRRHLALSPSLLGVEWGSIWPVAQAPCCREMLGCIQAFLALGKCSKRASSFNVFFFSNVFHVPRSSVF